MPASLPVVARPASACNNDPHLGSRSAVVGSDPTRCLTVPVLNSGQSLEVHLSMSEKVQAVKFRKTDFRKGHDPTDTAIGFAVCLIGSLIIAGILYAGIYVLVCVAAQNGLNLYGI